MNYEDKIQQVIEETNSDDVDKNIITLDSGVKLALKPVPLLRVQALVDKFKYPPVPEVYDPDKDRTYKNPFDPVYQEMRQAVDMERTWAVVDAVLAFGTRLHSKPDDVPAVEDDTWIEELTIIGMEVNTTSALVRYLMWAKYVAIVSVNDLQAVTKQFGLNMGVSEEQIAETMASNFPGVPARTPAG